MGRMLEGMVKRKRGLASGSSGPNVTKSAKKFDIPTLLKTEQIEVKDIRKPEITTPCTDSKTSNIKISADNILTFTCGGCGAYGIHQLGLEYRLVKTAMVVESGTQTGDESSSSKVPVESANDLCLVDENNPISVHTSSTASPSVVSSKNEDTSEDEDCSHSDEEESSSDVDTSSSDLTDETLSDSSEEEDMQSSSHKPTSTTLSQLHILPQQCLDNQQTTSSLGFRQTSARVKRTQPKPGENGQNVCYPCKIIRCSVVKSSEKDLFEHVRIDHADRKHRCNVCPMAFTKFSNLTQHNFVHSGDKPHQCDECGMKFSHKRYLVRHQLLIHNEQTVVSCRLKNCRARLPKNELYEHIRTAHTKGKFVCDKCPRSFKFPFLLKRHYRSHNGIKPYECEVCGKKFSLLCNYNKHYTLHTGERPFKCDVCGNAYSRAFHMRRHMRLHTGEKPFPCSHCGKCFTEGMAKRKRGAASGILEENVTKSVGKVEIPALLKTEQIEVESNIKPEILTSSTDSKSSEISISADNILTFTCGGCWASGIHHLGSDYRLVNTAMLVEASTQTGDKSSSSTIPVESANNVSLINDQNNPISVHGSSTASPSVVSSNNEVDEDCSDSDGEADDQHVCLGVPLSPTGEPRDDTLSDSSEEEDNQSPSHKPTSTNVSQLHILSQQCLDNQQTTSSLGFRQTSARVKRTQPKPGENGQNVCYPCKIIRCSVVKSSEKDLFEHVRIDHADRKHRCNVCPMAFNKRSNLTNHNLVHSGDKPHQCEFSHKRYLVRHQLLIHNEQTVVSCRLKNCGVRLSKDELYEHIRTAHPKEKFQCDKCPYSFKYQSLLSRHYRSHIGIKSYECEVCDKKFTHLYHYKTHLNLHTGERLFKCDVCGKGFSQADYFRKHMRKHTSDKVIVCSHCGKNFTHSSNRKIHEISCSVSKN
eukprot:sb/3461793/